MFRIGTHTANPLAMAAALVVLAVALAVLIPVVLIVMALLALGGAVALLAATLRRGLGWLSVSCRGRLNGRHNVRVIDRSEP